MEDEKSSSKDFSNINSATKNLKNNNLSDVHKS